MAEPIQEETFESVWEALEDSPEEAASMRLRSEVMIAVQQVVTDWDITRTAAARRLELSEHELDELLGGRIGKFSMDRLIRLAARAGLEVRMEIARAAA